MSQSAKCLEWSQCSVGFHLSPPFCHNEEKAQTSWAGVDSVLCKSEQMRIETSKPAGMCLLLQVITADSRRSGKSSYKWPLSTSAHSVPLTPTVCSVELLCYVLPA